MGDGYGRGEGFVSAILQRQQSEQRQACFGIILGSAVNQAGRSSGLTAPNGPAQAALVKTALSAGSVPSTDVRCLSVHGTGTPLGDPIEVGALAQALQGFGQRSAACRAIVSNKSCFGHTEGAAGLTGLLLAASVVSQDIVPAIMHLRGMNPYVQAALADWSKSGHTVTQVPRQCAAGSGLGTVAGSSSFGMSGVNAHMVLARDSSSSGGAAPAPTAIWRGDRTWPLPPAQSMLDEVVRCTRDAARFMVRLAKPAMSFIWDHQVSATAALPAWRVTL